MITADSILNAQDTLIEDWGDAGRAVIVAAHQATPFDGLAKDFLMHCTACGGNWGGMLLTGIRELYPEVWDVIPDNMGVFAFRDICSTLILLNVDID